MKYAAGRCRPELGVYEDRGSALSESKHCDVWEDGHAAQCGSVGWDRDKRTR